MDKELLMILCVASSILLGMFGGYKWKWIKRFLLPLILGIIAIISGFSLYKALGMIICLSGALCLPYGEKTSYWLKTLVFMAIFGSTAWLGFTWWVVISPILAIILFKISNTKWGQNIIFWKAWEAITFLLLGLCISSLIGR